MSCTWFSNYYFYALEALHKKTSKSILYIVTLNRSLEIIQSYFILLSILYKISRAYIIFLWYFLTMDNNQNIFYCRKCKGLFIVTYTMYTHTHTHTRQNDVKGYSNGYFQTLFKRKKKEIRKKLSLSITSSSKSKLFSWDKKEIKKYMIFNNTYIFLLLFWDLVIPSDIFFEREWDSVAICLDYF